MNNQKTLAIIAVALAITLAAGIVTISVSHLAFAKTRKGDEANKLPIKTGPTNNAAIMVAYTSPGAFA